MSRALFGTVANRLGITPASWSSCAGGYPACQEPFGACTAISGGGPYDQFSAFRADTMARVSPVAASVNCSFLFNDNFVAPFGTYWATYLSCDYGGGLLGINAFLATSLINMTYGWGRDSAFSACVLAVKALWWRPSTVSSRPIARGSAPCADCA